MTVRLTDHFGHRYLIEDAEFIDTAMFGKCIRGWYCLERDYCAAQPGEGVPIQLGDFRLDTARSWEVLSGQLELAA